MNPRITLKTLSLSIPAALVCLGCESVPGLTDAKRVATSEEVANVYVAAYPAVPWASISEKLQPKHALTTADARAMAAITTRSQVDQFLSTFAVGLGVGLPSRTTASTTAIGADGAQTTTGTKTLAPGTVPTSSGAASTAIADSALVPDLSKLSVGVGLDAATQLQVGTGVYQLAQILDNQITNSIAPLGYEAHLLTLQINLQPYGRNLPYDAYVNVTLLPGSWSKALKTSAINADKADELPPVIMYPLVISDAMETANVGKSVEVVRQAALALSGIVANAGFNFGLSGGSNRLNNILGADRNSLVTLGRVSDHTLRIRLGAQLQGSRTLALVPSTHNVSVVVFTRSGDSDETHLDKLSVITQTSFVDVESGVEVPSRRNDKSSEKDRIPAVLNVLKTYNYRLSSDCDTDRYTPLDLLRTLDRGDYGGVMRCLVWDQSLDNDSVLARATREIEASASSASAARLKRNEASSARVYSIDRIDIKPPPDRVMQDPLGPAEEARLRRVVAQLMTLQVDSRFSKMLVQLQPFKSKKIVLPAKDQLVIISDDGKASAKMTVRAGANLKADHVSAKLKVRNQGVDTWLLATGVAVDGTGKDLTITFPSISAIKLQPEIEPPKGAVKPSPAPRAAKAAAKPPAAVEPGKAASAAGTGSESLPVPGPDQYAVTVAYQMPQDEAPKEERYIANLRKSNVKAESNPVSTTTGVLIADSGGLGRISVIVGDWSDATRSLSLTVSGADIRAIEGGKFDAALGGVSVAPKSVVTLSLGNLTSAVPVTISTVAAEKPVGSAIVLAVERERSSAKQ